jgi:predicted transcriptional regulator YheO
MKKILVSDAIYVFLTNEEYDMSQMAKDTTIQRNKLTDRQKYIASKLHQKGVFACEKKNNNVYYKLKTSGFI